MHDCAYVSKTSVGPILVDSTVESDLQEPAILWI